MEKLTRKVLTEKAIFKIIECPNHKSLKVRSFSNSDEWSNYLEACLRSDRITRGDFEFYFKQNPKDVYVVVEGHFESYFVLKSDCKIIKNYV
jgi:hypothetical protein